jgi:hypothetical protein
MGKAVPAGEELPSLIYALDQASSHKKVDLVSIATSTGSGSSGPASGSPSASASGSGNGSANASSGSGQAAAVFTPMQFTFVFNGSYIDLYHLFEQLNRFTVRTAAGGLRVSGRLLTIQSVKLAPATGAEAGSGKAATEQLTATVSATAYVLPAFIGLASGPTAASLMGATQPAAATGASSSPTAPAIARVSP